MIGGQPEGRGDERAWTRKASLRLRTEPGQAARLAACPSLRRACRLPAGASASLQPKAQKKRRQVAVSAFSDFMHFAHHMRALRVLSRPHAGTTRLLQRKEAHNPGRAEDGPGQVPPPPRNLSRDKGTASATGHGRISRRMLRRMLRRSAGRYGAPGCSTPAPGREGNRTRGRGARRACIDTR